MNHRKLTTNIIRICMMKMEMSDKTNEETKSTMDLHFLQYDFNNVCFSVCHFHVPCTYCFAYIVIFLYSFCCNGYASVALDVSSFGQLFFFTAGTKTSTIPLHICIQYIRLQSFFIFSSYMAARCAPSYATNRTDIRK